MDSEKLRRFISLIDASKPQPTEQMQRRAEQIARISAELDSHAPIVSARVRQHRYLPPAIPPKR